MQGTVNGATMAKLNASEGTRNAKTGATNEHA